MGVWAEVYDFQAPPCAGPARRRKQIVPTARSLLKWPIEPKIAGPSGLGVELAADFRDNRRR